MRGSTGLFLSPILLLAATAGIAGAQQVASGADVSAITAISTAEIAAIVAGDLDAQAAVLADDAVYLPPGEPAVKGKAAIRSWTEAFLAAMSVDGGYPSSEVDVIGDWAIERYTIDITLTPADGSEPMRETGKGIHVYRRGADGAWKLTYDIWNWDSSSSETSEMSEM